MNLKPQLDKTPVTLPPSPAWGDLAEPGEPVGVIRFECEDGAYSYPYHVLAQWVLQGSAPETLVIHAGSDRVIVRGRQLDKIRNALDSGRLQVVRCTNERYIDSEVNPVVERIEVESKP